MQSDRELLEAAAMAAGLAVDGGAGMRNGLHLVAGGFWNPLTDDGDALRLAVKLGLFGSPEMTLEFVYAMGAATEEERLSDTRRAVVLAAAMAEHKGEKP